MDIVNAEHTIDLHNVIHHIFDIHISRCGFQQDVNRFAQDTPSVEKDEEANQDTGERVEPLGIREVDDNTCNDCTRSGEHIAHEMDKSRTQIEIALTAAMNKHRSNEINHNSNQTYTNEDT